MKVIKERKNTRRQHLIGESVSFSVVEAYKSARTSLMFTNTSDGCNVVVFTSSAPGEGKTITCSNLAIAMAQGGKKVLLIDSDMRKPQVSYTFKLDSSVGLSELLSGVVDMDDCPELCRQKTAYENLEIIAAGAIPPNPAELISGHRMKKLFEKLKGEYDYILIDTPPSLVVTDALLYKDVVDGYVIVVRANRTRSDSTARLLERFKQVNARVIGFILNDRIQKASKYKSYADYGQV